LNPNIPSFQYATIPSGPLCPDQRPSFVRNNSKTLLPGRLLTAGLFMDHYEWSRTRGIRPHGNHRKRIHICQRQK
jgi:hypothetical protein